MKESMRFSEAVSPCMPTKVQVIAGVVASYLWEVAASGGFCLVSAK
jgi:hypothetical protein